MSREYKDLKRKIDSLANYYYIEKRKEYNETLITSLRLELWSDLYELYTQRNHPFWFRQFRKSDKEYLTESLMFDVVNDSIIGTLDKNNFEPEKNILFTTYFEMVMQNQLKGGYLKYKKKKDNECNIDGETKPKDKERPKSNISIDNPKVQSKFVDVLKNETALEAMEELESKEEAECKVYERFLDMAQNIIRFNEIYTGKKKNPTREEYFRMFFTELVTFASKSDFLEVLKKRERDIWEALNILFLDYFMLEICRTFSEIQKSNLKPYSQVGIKQESEKETKMPFPNDVYRGYFLNLKNKEVTDSNVSQFWKHFCEEFNGIEYYRR